MSRRSRDELATIVARDMPGYRLVERSADSVGGHGAEAAEETAPVINVESEGSPKRPHGLHVAEELAEFAHAGVGAGAGDDAGEPYIAGEGPDEPEDELVTVGPAGAADAVDPSQLKSVVISGKDGRVLGVQG